MDIELKNITYNARLSEETPAYAASLYVDGKKIGTVSNAGHGGPDNFDGDREAYDRADKWCRENLPKGVVRTGNEDEGVKTHEFDTDLEMRCGELLEAHLLRRELRSLLRSKILYLNNNGALMETSYKGVRKIEAKHMEHFKAKAQGVRKILNELPEEEAFKLFRDNI